MKNMMLQVKNWSKSSIFNFQFSILCTLLILAAGCKKSDPFVDPGDTPDPMWTITVENDMTSSMTAIVKVSFTDQSDSLSTTQGTLAAFIGNDCCGIAEYQTEYDLYWLYISPAKEMTDVVLRFYSPHLKRIFQAKETFTYVNDGHIGTFTNPYIPKWTVAE